MTMNRGKISWLFLMLIIICAVGVFLVEHQRVLAFSGTGSGTTNDPYLITTAAELNEVRNDLSAYYRLEADLDLSGFPNWQPIGASAAPFTGTFDGNGHTIANLTITGTANHRGLFGFVSGGVIRNIGLIDVNVAGVQLIGGLVGMMENSVLEYAYVTGSVTGEAIVGGLVGYTVGTSQVHQSYASVEVTGETDSGGLVGYNPGAVPISNSYWDNTLADSSAGGVGRSTADLKQSSTFSGWNFSEEGAGSWGIIEGETFPMHRTTFQHIVLDDLTLEAEGQPVELDPLFSSDTGLYSARVTGDIDSVAVTGIPASGSFVSIDGGSDSETVTLFPGVNTVHVEVSSTGVILPGTSDDPFEVEYILTLIRESGSNIYPHRIRTADQLAAIGSGDFALNHHYELMNDLHLAEAGYTNWQPIGDSTNPFSGTFNGNQHVIHHLHILRAAEEEVGLFAANLGSIHHIGLENTDVVGGSQVGALVGVNWGTVSNVYARGTVTGVDEVGGLIGRNIGNVNHAYFAGETVGSAHVGGLLGSQSTGTVSSAYWDMDTSELSSSGGGEGKTTAEMQQQLTYSAWNFTNDWAMVEGTTYPMWPEHYEAVSLTDLTVAPAQGTADWNVPFTGSQGFYFITLDDEQVTEVSISATTADPEASITYNGSESGVVAVERGDQTVVIEVTGAEDAPQGIYQLHIHVPLLDPEVSFTPEGDEEWMSQVSVEVEVTDEDGVVDESSLGYVWTTLATAPTEESAYAFFELEGDRAVLGSLVELTGLYYLHIRMVDGSGHAWTFSSESFLLDNTAPEAPLIYVPKEGWTSVESVEVSITEGADEHSGSAITEYRTFGENDADWTDWIQYTGPFVIVAEGETDIEARTFDQLGNISDIDQAVVLIEHTAPQISLLGDALIMLLLGDDFEDPGVLVKHPRFDESDLDIVVTGEVDTGEIGVYERTYTVTDLAGNRADIIREVYVFERVLTLGETALVTSGLWEIEGSSSRLVLPEGLPTGTMLRVEVAQVDEEVTEEQRLRLAGEALTFTFLFPDGVEESGGLYTLMLALAVEADLDRVAIYRLNEETGEWEHRGGEVNNEEQTISLMLSHFSTYAVFEEEEEGLEETEESVEEEESGVEGAEESVQEEELLPGTATWMFAWMLAGIMLVVLGGVLFVCLSIKRKKKIL